MQSPTEIRSQLKNVKIHGSWPSDKEIEILGQMLEQGETIEVWSSGHTYNGYDGILVLTNIKIAFVGTGWLWGKESFLITRSQITDVSESDLSGGKRELLIKHNRTKSTFEEGNDDGRRQIAKRLGEDIHRKKVANIQLNSSINQEDPNKKMRAKFLESIRDLEKENLITQVESDAIKKRILSWNPIKK